MKICAFVNERVGYLTLRQLSKNKINVPLVFTSSQIRKSKISDWIDIKKNQDKFKNSKIIQIDNPNEEKVYKRIQRFKPDLIIAISWSQIIPKNIIDLPKYGVVSSHYSSLPKRRGGAPLFWAINDNLKKLGISIFYMEEGIDDGDIINQTSIPISKNENISSLMKKIYKKYPLFFSKNLKKIINNKSRRFPQNHSIATYTPSRKPKDGIIDFKSKSEDLDRFIRALSPPYPCAFFYAVDKNGNKKKFKLLKTNNTNGKLVLSGYLDK